MSFPEQYHFDFDFNINDIIIGLYLGTIDEDEIINILERNALEQYTTKSKDKVYNLDINKLDLLKEPINLIKNDIISQVDIINSCDIDNIKHLYNDLNEHTFYIEKINKKFDIDIKLEYYIILYHYLYNFQNQNLVLKKEYKNASEISNIKTNLPIVQNIKQNEKISIPPKPKIKSTNCKKCNCKRIKLTKTIEYRECSSQSISIYKNKLKTYGYVTFFNCYEDYLGFFRSNGDFLQGIYNSHNSTCKCCNNYQITGDLRFNTFTKNYEPNGYAIIKHYNSKNEVINRMEGEFKYGKHIEDCGNIHDKCANCNKNKPNVVCLKCKKYLCLECDMKIHLPIMKKNNIINHKRSYFDNDVIYQYPRYLIELRQFIIKQSGKLYTIKYHSRTKDVDSLSKTLFSPNVLYYKNETEYSICDKIIKLMKEETNDLEISYQAIKDITESMNFNIQKDTILQ